MQLSSGGVWWPLLLSTLAGLSTSIGGLIAINLFPDESTLAFLLGTAVGVMSTVSVAELWVHKAIEHSNWLGITAAVAAGAVVFAVVDPLLPKPVEPQQLLAAKDSTQEGEEPLMVKVHQDAEPQVTLATSVKRQSFAPRQGGTKLAVSTTGHASSGSTSIGSPKAPAATAAGIGSNSSSASNSSCGGAGKPGSHAAAAASCPHSDQPWSQGCDCHSDPSRDAGSSSSSLLRNGSGGGSMQGQLQLLRSHHAGLMRLGLLMALTMTLHNAPEGFAVAFSAMTSVGPMICGAIAMHNIPEGLVIAAPIYAATGSKARALAVTTLSGLSEPLGAALALFVFKPFVNSMQRLDVLLAFVGGIMLAVCVLELWPEGRKCRQDARLIQGCVLGAVLMGWTLYLGV